jgi:ubiquitin C-terminal hydrolase
LNIFAPQFCDRRQHDAQEFLTLILFNLNKELKFQNEFFIEKTFEGTFQKRFRCRRCNNISYSKKQDKFFVLNIPASSPKVYERDMRRFLRELTNETDIEWSCSKCDREDVESKLSLFISKLPKILIIRLKPSVGYNSLVLYDFKLDMAEFFKGENCMNEVTQYNLIGVVNHYGTNSGGHCK